MAKLFKKSVRTYTTIGETVGKQLVLIPMAVTAQYTNRLGRIFTIIAEIVGNRWVLTPMAATEVFASESGTTRTAIDNPDNSTMLQLLTRNFAYVLLFVLISIPFALVFPPSAQDASAACRCECVNGEVVPLCSNSLDLAPICPPRIWPIVPPSNRAYSAAETCAPRNQSVQNGAGS